MNNARISRIVRITGIVATSLLVSRSGHAQDIVPQDDGRLQQYFGSAQASGMLMGRVLAAIHDGRPVADVINVFHENNPDTTFDEHTTAAFEAAIRAAGTGDHPSAVWALWDNMVDRFQQFERQVEFDREHGIPYTKDTFDTWYYEVPIRIADFGFHSREDVGQLLGISEDRKAATADSAHLEHYADYLAEASAEYKRFQTFYDAWVDVPMDSRNPLSQLDRINDQSYDITVLARSELMIEEAHVHELLGSDSHLLYDDVITFTRANIDRIIEAGLDENGFLRALNIGRLTYFYLYATLQTVPPSTFVDKAEEAWEWLQAMDTTPTHEAQNGVGGDHRTASFLRTTALDWAARDPDGRRGLLALADRLAEIVRKHYTIVFRGQAMNKMNYVSSTMVRVRYEVEQGSLSTARDLIADLEQLEGINPYFLRGIETLHGRIEARASVEEFTDIDQLIVDLERLIAKYTPQEPASAERAAVDLVVAPPSITEAVPLPRATRVRSVEPDRREHAPEHQRRDDGPRFKSIIGPIAMGSLVIIILLVAVGLVTKHRRHAQTGTR